MSGKGILIGFAFAVAMLIAVAMLAARTNAQQAQDGGASLAALETKLTMLEREVLLLEDTKAIKRLQRAYGYYADKKLSAEITELFATDATAEVGGLGVFVGKARVAQLYDFLLGGKLEHGQLFNHMILQGVVHVGNGGTTAKGRWRALIQIGEHGESAIWSEGPYENVYVKEDGVWKISRLHWYATLTAPYDPGWHKAQMPMDGPSEVLPPDRPPSELYRSYPSAYLPPYHYDNPVSGRKAGDAQ
jgi:hypothetical protein